MTFPFPIPMSYTKTVFFPIVEGSTTYDSTSTATNPVIHQLPTGIVAGELLFLIVTESNSGGARASTPTGWTRIVNQQNTNGNNLFVYYKVAVGGETTVSQNQGSAGFSFINSASYRISHYTGTPAANSTQAGPGTGVNPPSLTSGFGSVKTLWLAVGYNSFFGYSSTPANYSNILVASGGRLNIGERELIAATEDPASFVATSSTNWCAATIAIRGLNT